MKQPSRKKTKPTTPSKIIVGLDYCNDCPFLLFEGLKAKCNSSDVFVDYEDKDHIIVPTWCGNKKA